MDVHKSTRFPEKFTQVAFSGNQVEFSGHWVGFSGNQVELFKKLGMFFQKTG